MVHKITIGIHDKRLGPGETTIPLVGPGNPSKKMQKFLKRANKVPTVVMERAIQNELARRRRTKPPRKPKR